MLSCENKKFPWRNGIFLCSDLEEPMTFFAESRSFDVNRKVYNEGGFFIDNFSDDPHTIILTKYPAKENEITLNDYFDIKFLEESLKDKSLKDLNNFRFGQSFFEPYDANLILQRKLKWVDIKLQNNKNIFSKYVHIYRLPDTISEMAKLYKEAETFFNPLLNVNITQNCEVQLQGLTERSTALENGDDTYHKLLLSNMKFLEGSRWLSFQAGGRDVKTAIDPKNKKTWGNAASTYYNGQMYLLCNLILGIEVCLKRKEKKEKDKNYLSTCFMCKDLAFDVEKNNYDRLLRHANKHVIDSASDHRLMLLINGVGGERSECYNVMYRYNYKLYNKVLTEMKWSDTVQQQFADMNTPPHA